jgi:hypothetical protein
MNHSNLCFINSLTFLKETTLKRFNILLNAQQKRIALIAMIALTVVVSSFFLRYIYFKAKNLTSAEKDSISSHQFEKNQSSLLQPLDDCIMQSENKVFETSDSSENKQSVVVSPKISKPHTFNIDGKLISLRTIKSLQKLEKDLALLGKVHGSAVDNGDCFWHAFAQGLSAFLGREVTIKELRKKVSEEILRLDKRPNQENWVKKMMIDDYMDTYEQYRDRVAFTCGEVLEKGWLAPIWGQEKRDGVILCQLYQVNLKVYSVGCINDHPSQMEDEENFYSGEDDFPKNQPYESTVEIALYTGHFLPVRNAEA